MTATYSYLIEFIVSLCVLTANSIMVLIRYYLESYSSTIVVRMTHKDLGVLGGTWRLGGEENTQ